MNIQEALKDAEQALSSCSDSARLDAELLLCHTLACQRTYLYAHSKDLLSSHHEKTFLEWLELRKKSIPIAYLLGEKEFWSLKLKLSTKTLIPRPATESIIEHILHLPLPPQAQICDLGTGSGAIALSLAKERPNWHIIATDIQANALSMASANAKRYQLQNIQFLWSNWFDKLPQKQFDVIVSNPPYIDAKDPHLFQGDVQYEPLKSLVSPEQGFADLFHLIQTAKKHLHPQGFIILEHGYQQQEILLEALAEAGFSEVLGYLDHEALPRFCVGQNHEQAIA
jgi:release factor glutamine methyltransferase